MGIWIKFLTISPVLAHTIKANFFNFSEKPLSCLGPAWHFTNISSFRQLVCPCSNAGCRPLSSTVTRTDILQISHVLSYRKLRRMHWSKKHEEGKVLQAQGVLYVSTTDLETLVLGRGQLLNFALHLGRWSSLASIPLDLIFKKSNNLNTGELMLGWVVLNL